MDMISKEYIRSLAQLEMIDADNNSVGLIHTSELKSSTINYYQRIHLEKAKKIGADAVYFRNCPKQTSKASIVYF